MAGWCCLSSKFEELKNQKRKETKNIKAKFVVGNLLAIKERGCKSDDQNYQKTQKSEELFQIEKFEVCNFGRVFGL